MNCKIEESEYQLINGGTKVSSNASAMGMDISKIIRSAKNTDGIVTLHLCHP